MMVPNSTGQTSQGRLSSASVVGALDSGHDRDPQFLTAGPGAARVRLGATVLQPALSDLSNVDRTYLLKMAEDTSASRVNDIAERLSRPQKYAGVYWMPG
jgi:hypothetical protein